MVDFCTGAVKSLNTEGNSDPSRCLLMVVNVKQSRMIGLFSVLVVFFFFCFR